MSCVVVVVVVRVSHSNGTWVKIMERKLERKKIQMKFYIYKKGKIKVNRCCSFFSFFYFGVWAFYLRISFRFVLNWIFKNIVKTSVSSMQSIWFDLIFILHLSIPTQPVIHSQHGHSTTYIRCSHSIFKSFYIKYTYPQAHTNTVTMWLSTTKWK